MKQLVSIEDNARLMKKIEEFEVAKAIWSLDMNKAPGPNSFTIHFYQDCWDLIKYDLIQMLRYVQKSFRLVGGQNLPSYPRSQRRKIHLHFPYLDPFHCAMHPTK
jgi:hypothetical protein